MTRTARRPAWMSRPASPKAVAFARTLTNDREVPAGWADRIEEVCDSGDAGEVSAMIDALKALPYKADDRPATEPGYYVSADGEFFLIKENRAKTGTYAMALVIEDGAKPRWEYAPGIARQFAGAHPMTVQEAAAFGHMHGYCIRGFERLNDPVSVIVGYGARCAEKAGWPYPRTAAEKRALIAAAA